MPDDQPSPSSSTASAEPRPVSTLELQPSPNVQQQTSVPLSSPTTSPTPDNLQGDNRIELLSRARSFLTSPQVQYQDTFAKRRFLAEKGLNETEIENLLRELPPQIPLVPPRTYPQPPPSNLPNLLIGIFRLFSWIAGGSAALVFIYYRFLLPRITRTALARHTLRSHHSILLQKFTTSLETLKKSQTDTLATLPRPYNKESTKFTACHSIDDILKELKEGSVDIKKAPLITLLRCGLEDLTKTEEGHTTKPNTDELFRYLESKIPWLASEDGFKMELWVTLSTCPLFEGTSSTTAPEDESNNQTSMQWTYIASKPPQPSPLVISLAALTSSLPKEYPDTDQTASRHILQTLSDFTGYLSAQVYLPYRPSINGMSSSGASSFLSPAEEEVRREIRALKGLALNRRSFMPATYRPESAPPQRAS